MRIFLDANILVALLNKEYPVFGYAARIVSLVDNKAYKVYTSAICLAIAFYFAEKKCGHTMAKKKIAILSEKLLITSVGSDEVLLALRNVKVNDFEDGMQYYAAIKNKCTIMVTEDVNDFYFSDIKVHTAEQFLQFCYTR